MLKQDFVLVGVGGQGTILASDILAAVGLQVGYDVKKSEVHGMAQRGGSVVSLVRWADQVHSPLIGDGQADYLLAFEKLEVLRYTDMLKPGGTALINDYAIAPLSVSSGEDEYPSDERILSVVRQVTSHAYLVPAATRADALGNARVNNVVLIGALSQLVANVPTSVWVQAIRERVPSRLADLNERAFMAGQDMMRSLGAGR
jgi:indolepyruvate ferredoxin oxidoreductase, beta subunit